MLFYFQQNPALQQLFFIYEYSCPGCNEKYIGKTEFTLHNRTREHAWNQKDSAIFQHFQRCDRWHHIKGLHGINEDEGATNTRELQINAVRNNIKVIRRSDNWLTLAFKESLAIKDRKPTLNHGVKASKDLCLF